MWGETQTCTDAQTDRQTDRQQTDFKGVDYYMHRRRICTISFSGWCPAVSGIHFYLFPLTWAQGGCFFLLGIFVKHLLLFWYEFVLYDIPRQFLILRSLFCHNGSGSDVTICLIFGTLYFHQKFLFWFRCASPPNSDGPTSILSVAWIHSKNWCEFTS